MATIDPPRSIRIKTSTGWADLALAGAPGYPPTTGKLSNVLTVSTDGAAPTWQPTQPSGSTIAYVGAYDPARTYHDGDYAVGADGVTYQCVTEGTHGVAPTPWTTGQWGIPLPVVNGQWVKGVGGSAVWAAITQADVSLTPYGTTLPASPFNGQEAILVDSTTNPTYQWRFRYNAGSTSTYKWEFVGGAPSVSGPIGATSGLNNSFGAIGLANGPQLTVPRAGDYMVGVGMFSQNAGGYTAAQQFTTSEHWSTSGNVNTFFFIANGPYGGARQYNVFRRNARAAAETVSLLIATNGTDTANFDSGYLSLTPARVS